MEHVQKPIRNVMLCDEISTCFVISALKALSVSGLKLEEL